MTITANAHGSVIDAARDLLDATRLLSHERPGKLSPAWAARKAAFENAIQSLKFEWGVESSGVNSDAQVHAAVGSIADAATSIRKWIELRERGAIGDKFKARWVKTMDEAVSALARAIDDVPASPAIASNQRKRIENDGNAQDGADSADNPKNSENKLPENADVIELCKLLKNESKKPKDKQRKQIDIAREFASGTPNPEKTAQSLLRQRRRFPQLCE